MSEGGLFRDFQRDYRPLSHYLEEKFLRQSLANIGRFTAEDLEPPTADLVEQIVSEARVEGPSVIGIEPGSSRTHGGAGRPGTERGLTLFTNRHFVAIGISGDIEMLRWWPDEADRGLVPVNVFDEGMDLWPEDCSVPYDEAAALVRHARRQADDLWDVGMRDASGPWALYTFVDLTDGDEEAVDAGEIDPRATIDSNLERVAPIIDAIREQSEHFFADELPRRLTEAVERRRGRVRSRAAVRLNLTWGDGWRFAVPHVVEPAKSHEPVEVLGEPSEEVTLSVRHRERLDPATATDVQRTIRVWVDAVERYPKAFRELPEDRLSDLLAATLNASLPGANREVYSRGGKSDIYIKADVLNEGLGPEKIFICESKWWSGASNARQALGQLLGYLDVRDTFAVLLFFIKNKNPGTYRLKAIKALEDCPGHSSATPGVVENWPIMVFNDRGRRVELCVAFVQLPPN